MPANAVSASLCVQLITSRELEFPEGAAAFPPAAQDLIDQLLQLDPSKRLGEQHQAALGTVAARGHISCSWLGVRLQLCLPV